MRNVVVFFIIRERLRVEIFIDIVRIFKGLKSLVEFEDRVYF